MSRRTLSRSVCPLLLTLGFLASPSAMAVTIVDHDCSITSNTMRYACSVELDDVGEVRIAVRPTAGGTWIWSQPRQIDGSPYTTEITLYNFEPGEEYEYKVAVTDGPMSSPTTLGTPAIPALLVDLNWDISVSVSPAPATKYVMFDTKDCEGGEAYIVAMRIKASTGEAYISWYQDMGTTGLVKGWSLDTTDPNFPVLWAIVDNTHVYAWQLDGTVVFEEDSFEDVCSGDTGDEGPCPHHDIHYDSTNGNTYVLISSPDDSIDPDVDTVDFSSCEDQDSFMMDGVRVYDDTWSSSTDTLLMPDMGFDCTDPGGGGPWPSCSGDFYWGSSFDPSFTPIDWTHVNSIFVTHAGETERWTLSSQVFSEIIRYDVGTDTVLWTLNGDDPDGYGGFTIENADGLSGPEGFSGQHDVTNVDGDVLLFDNRNHAGGYAYGRAILVNVDSDIDLATIEKSWVVRYPTTHTAVTGCTRFGSATIVPTTEGENALVDCGSQAIIEEISENDGNTEDDPLLYIHVPTDDTCQVNDDAPTGFHWYRAFPLLQLGEF